MADFSICIWELFHDLPWRPLVRLSAGATGSIVFSKTGATTAATTNASNVDPMMGWEESLEK